MSPNKLSLCLAVLSSCTELHASPSPASGLCYITVAGCGFGTVVFSRSGKNTIVILQTNLVFLNSLKLTACFF